MAADPISITLDEKDMAKVRKLLSADGLDLRGLMADYADDFHARAAQLFDSAGGSRGKPWDQNSPGYLAKKKAHYGEKRPLFLTGALAAAMSEDSAQGGVTDITDEGMTIGTTLGYADRMHRGDPGDRWIGEPFNMTVHGVPARPFLYFEPTDADRWVQMAGEWIEQAVARVAS